MTNHWIDLQNSDCILIMGSNAAANHPISFKWVTKAQEKGATVIHVDPRFTKTSTKADIYASIRSGADIAVLGGMIKYILDNDLIFKDYVVDYTNASFIIGDKYTFDDGIFAGYNPETKSYDKSQWAFAMDENGNPKKDPTLQDPRCVYQMLKKHYARYDMDKVVSISGMKKDDLIKLYETYTATGTGKKAGTIMYAMGWTQHTVGVQNIRSMAMIQLLLGNIGIAGGGVNALRGESNVQGSTDHCLLFHILPGYLKTPQASQPTLADYNAAYTPKSNDPKSANWWQNYPKYSASLIKSMWQDDTPEVAYNYLPRLDSAKATEYSWLALFDKMSEGKFKGLFAWGMNPACSGANSNKTRKALGELDWLVNVNIFPNETGWFWEGPGMDPKSIKTEVFFLPCAVSIEKEGSITNSGRWMQWRYKGPDAPHGLKPDGDLMYELMKEIRHLYEKEGGVYSDPITRLTWDGIATDGVFDPHKTAKLINGFFTRDVTIKDKVYKKGTQVPSFAFLQADGSTASGNWLYANSYTEKGNMAARRSLAQTPEQANIGLYPNFSWCWPVNRRILYNRASVDLQGNPWNPDKAVIKWTGPKTKWTGDVPDGGWAPGTKYAFIMRKHGFGQLFGPGRADGPLPEYYEPLECPVKAHPFSGTLHNPTALSFADETKAVCDPKYPLIGTTYRVTEHWQTGLMTRNCDWLTECEPQVFVEMSEELAQLKGFKNGEKVQVESVRGSMWGHSHRHQTDQAVHGRRLHRPSGGSALALWLDMAEGRRRFRQPSDPVRW